jgi:hypothetical protein
MSDLGDDYLATEIRRAGEMSANDDRCPTCGVPLLQELDCQLTEAATLCREMGLAGVAGRFEQLRSRPRLELLRGGAGE